MKEILKNKLYLGNKLDYLLNIDQDWAFVHIGTKLFDENNSTNTNSDYYITNKQFYIKWQDMPDFEEFNVDTLEKLFDFIDGNSKGITLIHCDYGQSRSPAITMCYLVKRKKLLNINFEKSVKEFQLIYPDFFAEGGITKYIKQEWNNFEQK
jgi:protein tyrosine phosphatase